MTDFLLELLSEEIPARMQDKASADLARLFAEEIAKAGLVAGALQAYAAPRRLALIARGLPESAEASSEEIKGPRASAPPQALEGFLRKTGLAREQLVERDGVLFAVIDKLGRATADVLAEAIPAIVRAFPWPKSMRWGDGALRWVRPLQGIVALLGDEVVRFEIDGIASGAMTLGHRFHHPGPVTIGNADDYAAKLRACHVILDPEERRAIIRERAAALAGEAGLAMVPDEGLVVENAGLTEWPVPLLGRFDPAFLKVPREVIQLTMRTNQKYFALTKPDGALAPNFICTANIDAADGGAAIAAGNARVLSARLADARFFWEQDLKVPLEEQAKKLEGVVFHEKLGTVADKVERVAKLARWLVEEGIVQAQPGSPERSRGTISSEVENTGKQESLGSARPSPSTALGRNGEGASLADMAEQAARLCKADLVTAMVGEFPELQGVMGGYYARAEDYPDEVADAIRDHYKPVGQGDDVPTAPVTVAVSLADKLDTIVEFFSIDERPTGSKDPFALRRAALGIIAILKSGPYRVSVVLAAFHAIIPKIISKRMEIDRKPLLEAIPAIAALISKNAAEYFGRGLVAAVKEMPDPLQLDTATFEQAITLSAEVRDFLWDRLEIAERQEGRAADIIRAATIIDGDRGREDDLVRLLARVKALQAFVASEEGANLLAGYKRAANILKKEGWDASPAPSRLRGDSRGEGQSAGRSDAPEMEDGSLSQPSPRRGDGFSYAPELAEAALAEALDIAIPAASSAVEAEDFAGAMTALAALRAPIDRFFDEVTVNDPDPAKRANRLALLEKIRAAMHKVADFSKIEG